MRRPHPRRGVVLPGEWVVRKDVSLHGGYGFQRMYCGFGAIKDIVTAHVNKLNLAKDTGATKACRLVITGASLGGALANLCAADAVLNDWAPSWPMKLETFGAPRVWRPSSKYLIKKHFEDRGLEIRRWVNQGDPVPSTPHTIVFGQGWEHLGHAHCIKVEAGGIFYYVEYENEDFPFAGNVYKALNEIGSNKHAGINAHLLSTAYVPRLLPAMVHCAVKMNEVKHNVTVDWDALGPSAEHEPPYEANHDKEAVLAQMAKHADDESKATAEGHDKDAADAAWDKANHVKMYNPGTFDAVRRSPARSRS